MDDLRHRGNVVDVKQSDEWDYFGFPAGCLKRLKLKERQVIGLCLSRPR